MKISTFFVSVIGLCVLYVYYADWIDEILDGLAEGYLGSDYEEVAPFIPSGVEEFDSLLDQLPNTPKTGIGPIFVAVLLVFLTVLLILVRFGKGLDLGQGKPQESKSQKRDSVHRKKCRESRKAEDEPVHVIWKGNSLMESSMHCNLKDGSKVHKEVLQTKAAVKPSDLGGGDDLQDVAPSSSNESTVQRLTEIRKLLESEPEIVGKMDKSAGTEDFPISIANSEESCQEKDSSEDPKLMNRIRLLESRLRLEELKNRNWINRMSRAEGILQQLNKQVERIEQSRPIETTLMETLKITSTVTNWLERPKTNFHFTMIKSYPPRFRQPRSESLAEYVNKEITLPYSFFDPKRIMSMQKSPLVPALPPPMVTPQTSILSKLLSK